MRSIIFLGGKRSGSAYDAVTAAAEVLGLQTVVVTNLQSMIRDHLNFPNVHRMIYTASWNVASLKPIIRLLQREGLEIVGIVSFMDPLVSVATELAELFCDNRLSLPAIQQMEDKIRTRRVLKNTQFNPYYHVFRSRDSFESVVKEVSQCLPLVIKMRNSTGSKDVRQVRNLLELRTRLKMFRTRYPNEQILIEEYLPGPQYLVEVMIQSGVVTQVVIIEQHILNYHGHMVVDGYGVLVHLDQEFEENLMSAVSTIIEAFGMVTGTCHLELRRAVDGNWKLIEINPRMSGGAMNRMIELAFGVDYAEQTLKLILGEEPDVTHRIERHVYTKFITVKTPGILLKVTGKQRALNVPGVEEVFVKPTKGQRLYPPRSMGCRYAHIISQDEYSLAAAKDTCLRGAEEIKFVTESW